MQNVYEDYHKLLSTEEIDILSISTKIENHHEIVLEATRYHIPVIICEKPIALSLKIASTMIKECINNNILLMINHERRFASDYHFVKELINKGDIGELVSIRGNILTGSPKSGTSYKSEGGGPLLHDGTHLIDIIRFLTDSEIDWVFANMTSNPSIQVEETITGILKLKNGVNCFIEAGGKRNYFSFELDIHATEGRIVIGNGILKLFKAKKSQYYTGFNDLIEQNIPSFQYKPQFINEINSVVQYLDSGIKPTSTGEDAYKALEIIFALYKSAIEKSKITLPLIEVDYTPLKDYLF